MLPGTQAALLGSFSLVLPHAGCLIRQPACAPRALAVPSLLLPCIRLSVSLTGSSLPHQPVYGGAFPLLRAGCCSVASRSSPHSFPPIRWRPLGLLPVFPATSFEVGYSFTPRHSRLGSETFQSPLSPLSLSPLSEGTWHCIGLPGCYRMLPTTSPTSKDTEPVLRGYSYETA